LTHKSKSKGDICIFPYHLRNCIFFFSFILYRFSAPEVGGGSNHPEAIQRLIELELRSNSKQIQPFPGGGHGQGIYGHELDMGFGYR
jgi:hypothetical protein